MAEAHQNGNATTRTVLWCVVTLVAVAILGTALVAAFGPHDVASNYTLTIVMFIGPIMAALLAMLSHLSKVADEVKRNSDFSKALAEAVLEHDRLKIKGLLAEETAKQPPSTGAAP